MNSLRVVTIFILILHLSSCDSSVQTKPDQFFINAREVNEFKGVTDYDGNTYGTVQIGNQVWTTENLKTTHFLNGDPITEAKTIKEWEAFFLKKMPCYKRVGKSFIYNGYVAIDSRKLVAEDFSIPTYNDFDLLRKKLGKNADRQLSMYDWDQLVDEEKVITIRGTNTAGFNAQKSGYLFANYWGETEFNQQIHVEEFEFGKYAWFWSKSNASMKDCNGYEGTCLKTILIGNNEAMICDEPREGPTPLATGIQIRLVKKNIKSRKVDQQPSRVEEYKSVTGIYLESIGHEYFEQVEGASGLLHFIEGEIKFNVDGRTMTFYVFEIPDNGQKASGVNDFWSLNPELLGAGAHGADYNYSISKNVGKKFYLEYRADKTGKLIIVTYRRVS